MVGTGDGADPDGADEGLEAPVQDVLKLLCSNLDMDVVFVPEFVGACG